MLFTQNTQNMMYVQECDPQTDQYVEVFQSIRQY